MPGGASIRTLLFALGLLAWATLAAAQSGLSDDAPPERWFAVERLNAGLPPAPDFVDRSTPMGAMESFLAAVRDRRLGDAAHLLDLSDVPTEGQPARGRELARKLGVILENHVWIDWGELPDRPDAVVQDQTGNNSMAGQSRRSLEVGSLALENREVPLRINRLKPGDGDPVWVFSRQTVGNIGALYEIYGPGWLRGLLPEWWRERVWFGLERWEYVALPAMIAVAVLIFLVLKLALRGLSRRAPWRGARRAGEAAYTLLAVTAAAGLLLYAAGTLLTFSAPVTSILQPLLIGVMAVAVTVALVRAADAAIDVVTDRVLGDTHRELGQEERQVYTSLYAARRIVLLIAFVCALGIVLMQFDVFGSLGLSLLASAGLLTVILGVAAQPTLGNILASLQIALAKPIRIGDTVQYEGEWAYVESIFYTHVRLRAWDDRRLIVPVQYFASQPFQNWSVVEEKMTRVFLLTVDPRADVEELRQAYLEIARSDEDVMGGEMLKVLVDHQDHNGMVVRFYCTAKDASTAWNMHCRLREKTLAWIRDNHPDWWPRQREMQFTVDGTAPGHYGEAAE